MDPKDPNMPQDSPPIPTELVIPKITDERLTELYSRIKPLVEISGHKYTLREFTFNELRNISYYWNHEDDYREIIEEDKLEPIQDFHCLHTFGYYGLFKPSIAEVLTQMPEELTEQADFFEIVGWPRDSEELNEQIKIVNAGYHLSRVRGYRLKSKSR